MGRYSNASFTTVASLEIVMGKVTERVLDSVVKTCLDKLVENIRDTYQTINNDYFIDNNGARTGQFIESFILGDIQKGLTAVFKEIIYEPEKMEMTRASFKDSWNAHMGESGEDIRAGLAEILNYGGKDSNTSASSTGIYERKKNPFWDETINWIEDNYRKLFKEAYAREGITIR